MGRNNNGDVGSLLLRQLASGDDDGALAGGNHASHHNVGQDK